MEKLTNGDLDNGYSVGSRKARMYNFVLVPLKESPFFICATPPSVILLHRSSLILMSGGDVNAAEVRCGLNRLQDVLVARQARTQPKTEAIQISAAVTCGETNEESKQHRN
ncbi:hypothetical protein Bca4012_010471 [Brassica carinata]